MTDKVEPIIEEGWIIVIDEKDTSSFGIVCKTLLYLKCNPNIFGPSNTLEWFRFLEEATIFESKKHADFAGVDVENTCLSDYKILKVRRTIEIIKEGE